MAQPKKKKEEKVARAFAWITKSKKRLFVIRLAEKGTTQQAVLEAAIDNFLK